jgi:excisionase family DNA binding protein
MRTAEQIFNELQHIPTSEQQKFFSLLAKKAFNNYDDNASHEELFGDLQNEFFTAKEAMEYLEVSSATFRRYIRDGRIVASTEVGSSHLFSLDDLRKLKSAIKLVKG